MIVHLIRHYYKTHTFGTLIVDGKAFYTLERPDLGNQRNISCFPAGVYKVNYMPRSASGKYRKVWHVQNVPGRGGILIHNGNLVSHTKGCILVGTKRGRLGGQPAVLASRTAMRQLLDIVGEQGFTLHVH